MVIEFDIKTLNDSHTGIDICFHFCDTHEVMERGIDWMYKVTDEIIKQSSVSSEPYDEMADLWKNVDVHADKLWTMRSDLPATRIKEIIVSMCNTVDEPYYYDIIVPVTIQRKDKSTFKSRIPVTVQIYVGEEIIAEDKIIEIENKES